MILVIAATVLAAAGVATVLILTFRSVTGGSSLPVTVEWIDNLSIDRYRPMLRLLDQSDFEFLRSQPGFQPAVARRLRRQRCDIFEGYLKSLSRDFGRTCAALKLIMVRAEYDRPDLATVLVRAQSDFVWGLVKVRFHLTLYRLGLASVDVAPLVSLFDSMQLELRSFVPVAG